MRGARGNYDYNEDLFVGRQNHRPRIRRVVGVEIDMLDAPVLSRETTDILCPEEADELIMNLELFLDEDNADVRELMEQRAQLEFQRQVRIANGAEIACAGCGCSESRACSGGCVWATRTVCSRCAAGGER